MGIRNKHISHKPKSKQKPKPKPTLTLAETWQYQSTFENEGLSLIYGAATPGVGLKKLLATGDNMPAFYRMKACLYLAHWDETLDVPEGEEITVADELACRYRWLQQASTEWARCTGLYGKEDPNYFIVDEMQELIQQDLEEVREDADNAGIQLAVEESLAHLQPKAAGESSLLAANVQSLGDMSNDLPGSWIQSNEGMEQHIGQSLTFQDRWQEARNIKDELDVFFGDA